MLLATTSLPSLALFLQWPIDWIILAVIAAILTLESFKSGSARTSALSMTLPISFLISQWLPNTFVVGTVVQQLTQPIMFAGVFIIVFIGIFFLLYRILFSYGSGGGGIMQALICGIATTIILVVFWIQTPGIREMWRFGPQVQFLFGQEFRAWWVTASFIALAFARG